jgi:hypothetical protein
MCPIEGPFPVLGNEDTPFFQSARYAWSSTNSGLEQSAELNQDQSLLPRSDPPIIEELIPKGDLLLAVGPSRRYFMITSSFLCEISPVFSVMFGPSFEEGNRLRSMQHQDSEMVLELPDDDAQAFYNTIRALYGADPSAKNYETVEIQKVAIVADKYDMAPRFTFAVAYWFAKYALTDDPEETWHLTTAAFWFKDSDAFYNFSKKLVKQLQESHLGYIAGMPDKVLGLRLCCKLHPVSHTILGKLTAGSGN